MSIVLGILRKIAANKIEDLGNVNILVNIDIITNLIIANQELIRKLC